jgi:hypothetical protein
MNVGGGQNDNRRSTGAIVGRFACSVPVDDLVSFHIDRPQLLKEQIAKQIKLSVEPLFE